MIGSMIKTKVGYDLIDMSIMIPKEYRTINEKRCEDVHIFGNR